MPSSVPPIIAIVGPMAVPATYLAWFVLPLLPWLRWAALRVRTRSLAGPLVVGVIYLAPDPRALEAVDVPLAAARQRVPLPRGRRPLRRAAERGLRHDARPTTARRVGRPHRRAGVPRLGAEPRHPAPAGDRHRPGRRPHRPGVAHHAARRRSARSRSPACSSWGPGWPSRCSWPCSGRTRARAVWHVPSDVAALQSDFGDRTGTVMQFSDFSKLQQRGVPVGLLERQVEELPARKHVRRGPRERGQPLHRHGAGPLPAQSLHVLRRASPSRAATAASGSRPCPASRRWST